MKVLSVVGLSLVFGFSAVVYPQTCRYDRYGQKDGPGGHMRVIELGPTVRSLVGTVVDQAGGPIIETIVVLKRIQGKQKTYVGTAETNSKGYFCFRQLRPGRYVLETGGTGFNALHMEITVVGSKSRVQRRWVRLVVPVGT